MFCKFCNKPLNSGNKIGYCAKCTQSNINGIKNHNYWKAAGIKITEAQIELHNKTTNCGLCYKEFTNDKVLDHCHKTGKVRGTICRQCNTSLGKLGDDIDLIIRKLRNYKKNGRG